ncbi:hypothetical protein GALMADRAFT_230863 [Galerina marginata CBS 339.88]|uniref:Uncharacterized protein n=1 Tax=Galerina marginata (strain CBS 339.88) TaxID=685588 RepID=A0A067SDP5_GALM3|nr:hypothetical protein GALMADRAFT_230863 [Galerina marginata CBS 339.88]
MFSLHLLCSAVRYRIPNQGVSRFTCSFFSSTCTASAKLVLDPSHRPPRVAVSGLVVPVNFRETANPHHRRAGPPAPTYRDSSSLHHLRSEVSYTKLLRATNLIRDYFPFDILSPNPTD